MTIRTEGEKLLSHGDDVWLTPDPSRIYRFDKDGRALAAA
jgi:multiple sugar transport system ATP-binding protein